MSCAQIPRKKLLPIVGLSLSTTSRALRDASAKALAKLMYLATIEQKEDEQQSDKYFNIAFKILLQFMTNEKNIPTLAITFHIFLRFFQPIEIVRKYRVFAKLCLSISAFNLPSSPLCLMSRNIFHAISCVTGKTAGLSLNHFMVEKLEPETMSATRSVIILDSLINFDASSKVLAKAAKAFYPLLTSDKKDVRRVVTSFFAKLGQKEPKAAQILLDSFMKWVSSNDAKPADIDGLSRGAAMLIMTSNISQESIQKILLVALSWIKGSQQFTSPRIAAAVLLLAASLRNYSVLFKPEIFAEIFAFLQKYFKSGPYANQKNPHNGQLIKFISCFLKQVVDHKPPNFDVFQNVFKMAVSSIISNEQNLSSPCLLSFLIFARKCPFLWENDTKIAQLIVNVIISAFQRKFSLIENETDYNLADYEPEVDQSHILYNAKVPLHISSKIDPSAPSLYFYLIQEARKSRSIQLTDQCLRDIGLWFSLCAANQQKALLQSLLSAHPKDVQAQFTRLSLLRCIYDSKCLKEPFFDSLTSMLQFQTFGNRRCVRMLAATVASYCVCFPQNIKKLIDFIESPKTSNSFTSFVISQLDFGALDEMARIRALLVLQRIVVSSLVATSHFVPESIFALSRLAEANFIPPDFVSQIVTLTEQCAYADISRSSVSLFYIVKTIEAIKPVDHQASLSNVAHCFFNFSVNGTLARLLSLRLLRMVHDRDYFARHFCDITKPETPLPLLVSRFFFPATIDDAPLLFMVLQQSGSADIEEALIRLFESDSDVRKWTELCKRVVIIGCVPPAERKGDVRIAPTMPVLLCAIKIAEQLVDKIRKSFPNHLTCVDDIVSISFNSIRMNEKEFDKHCFNTMAQIVRQFSAVRNKECAMLELYTSQFVPSLKYATDGQHDSASGSNFCLAYLAFLMESRSPFLGEATSTLVDGLRKIGFTKSNITVFCRIIGRLFTLLEKRDEKLTELFCAASKQVFDEIFTQRRKISELGDEMQFVILLFLDVSKDEQMNRHLLLILLEELQRNCCAMVLNTVTTLFEHVGAKLTAIDFAVDVLAHSQLLLDEGEAIEAEEREAQRKKDEGNSDSEEDKEEETITTFWLTPRKKMPSVSRFLTASSSLFPSPVTKDWESCWEKLVALSLHGNRCCYTPMSRLVHCASDEMINELGPSLVLSVLATKESEKQKALIHLILSRTRPEIIGALFAEIIATKVALSARFSVIRTALRMGGVPTQSALNDIAEVVSAALFPDGLAFVGSLIVDDKTALVGIHMLKIGVADAIEQEANKSIQYAPRILYFLYCTISAIEKFAPEVSDAFSEVVAKIVVNFLIQCSSIKDRKPVVIPACLILKAIKKEIAEKAFNESTDMKKAIQALTPPKHTQAIQLRAFGDVKSRKSSNTGGWQSLDVGDSSDED